jgi:Tfp pilus assembly protein PilV
MGLAEILVACVIVGIGLAGLLSVVPTAGYGIQEGQQLSTATFLANQRLEQVRSAPWTDMPANDCLGKSDSSGVAATSPACNGAAATTFPDESPMTPPYAGYSRTVRITDCSVAPGCGGITDAKLRQITVTVSYRASTATGLGATKSAIVSMLMAER